MASLNAADIFNVKDMVFVVTGGGTGIGAMMAKALDANGAKKVYIVGRRLEKLQETASQATNGSIVPIRGDVTSKDDLAAVAEKVQSEVGFVNTVVANSGITGPTTQSLKEGASIAEIQEFLWKEPMEAYTKTFELNCTAVLYTLLAFLPLLDAGNKNEASPYHVNGVKSQFITTASIASFNRKSTAGFGYGASKAGVAHLMKMMANFLAPHSIRVNVFCPGLFPSEMSAGTIGNHPDMEKNGGMPAEQIPATRMGTAEDIAGVVLFMTSRGGAYCNGNVLINDGGRLSIMPATY